MKILVIVEFYTGILNNLHVSGFLEEIQYLFMSSDKALLYIFGYMRNVVRSFKFDKQVPKFV